MNQFFVIYEHRDFPAPTSWLSVTDAEVIGKIRSTRSAADEIALTLAKQTHRSIRVYELVPVVEFRVSEKIEAVPADEK